MTAADTPWADPGTDDTPTPLTPARYQSKRHPEQTVEAVHLTDDATPDGSWDAIADWCGGRLVNHSPFPGGDPFTVLYIGDSDAVEGDWIVSQRTGFYVWSNDGFLDAYEVVR
jgi:hypothetical protein